MAGGRRAQQSRVVHDAESWVDAVGAGAEQGPGGWGSGQGHSLCMQPESVLTQSVDEGKTGLETHLTQAVHDLALRPEVWHHSRLAASAH